MVLGFLEHLIPHYMRISALQTGGGALDIDTYRVSVCIKDGYFESGTCVCIYKYRYFVIKAAEGA